MSRVIDDVVDWVTIESSTDLLSDAQGRWTSPYGHWSFKAKDSAFKSQLTKRGQQKMKNPIWPT